MFKCVQASFAEHSMEMDHLYISFGLNENIFWFKPKYLLVIMKIFWFKPKYLLV